MEKDENGRIEELKLEIIKLEMKEPEIGPELETILLDNWADGRIEKFFNSQTEDRLYDYICRVVKYYKKCHQLVSKIEAGNDAAWEQLLEKLSKWAYSFLKRKGLPSYVDLMQVAVDCANDSGARLMNIRFPYDVHYESWACRVVQNVCLNYIRKNTDRLAYVDYNSDLSETDEWLHELSVPSGTYRAENRMDLLDAIGQLNSDDRQRFIILYYFEGKSFLEIAEILERTPNALYKLHFDALENLRKVYGEEGDI